MIKEQSKLKEAMAILNSPELEEFRSIEIVKRLIGECIRANIPRKRSGFNIYDWAANDKLRPAMNYVWYDTVDKVAVASDSYVLVASYADYKDDFDIAPNAQMYDHPCVAINKKGEAYGGTSKYPDYKSIFPEPGTTVKLPDCISIEELKDSYLRAKEFILTNGVRGGYKPVIRIGEKCYVGMENAERLLDLPSTNYFAKVRQDGSLITYFVFHQTNAMKVAFSTCICDPEHYQPLTSRLYVPIIK